MIVNGMYFRNHELYDLINNCGGVWTDTKERPLFCCMKSHEHNDLFWAIPVGNWSHRNENAKKRILTYINFPKTRVESCYYHLGKTTCTSIFFISDAIPFSEKYIEREYIGLDKKNIHIVKNKFLISELERKLSRIIAFENSKNNHFRQHITSVKEHILSELLQK